MSKKEQDKYSRCRSVAMTDRVWNQLRALAYAEERPMSSLIREALRDLFEKRAGKKTTRMEYDPKTDTYKEIQV